MHENESNQINFAHQRLFLLYIPPLTSIDQISSVVLFCRDRIIFTNPLMKIQLSRLRSINKNIFYILLCVRERTQFSYFNISFAFSRGDYDETIVKFIVACSFNITFNFYLFFYARGGSFYAN